MHQNDCSYACELSGSTFEELSMVGGYTQDLKKAHNSQNWGVGGLRGDAWAIVWDNTVLTNQVTKENTINLD